MFSFLKNHPFAVEAFFESSFILTFAIPKEDLRQMIPECLVLDTFNDKWAFVAVAMVQTKALRPKGFPKIFGNNFFLIGYRIFVRYTNTAGRKLRGLYILQSETDKKRMGFLGNIFTHYNYKTTDIIQLKNSSDGAGNVTGKNINSPVQENIVTIKSIQSKFEVVIKTANEEVSLPPDSPFTNWKEARKFAGPLPFTFTFNPATKEVLIIEGVRQHWQPAPAEVISYHIPFLDSFNSTNIQLANAFVIQNIPYYWKKGKKEKWNN
jgi:Uncharacterized conserved protein (COG2071)